MLVSAFNNAEEKKVIKMDVISEIRHQVVHEGKSIRSVSKDVNGHEK